MKRILIKLIIFIIGSFLGLFLITYFNSPEVELYGGDILKLFWAMLITSELLKSNLSSIPTIVGKQTKYLIVERNDRELKINDNIVKIPFWTNLNYEIINDDVFIDMYQYDFDKKRLRITLRSVLNFLF